MSVEFSALAKFELLLMKPIPPIKYGFRGVSGPSENNAFAETSQILISSRTTGALIVYAPMLE
jgi:hypothetical protein